MSGMVSLSIKYAMKSQTWPLGLPARAMNATIARWRAYRIVSFGTLM
jgi:hypothetical protein